MPVYVVAKVRWIGKEVELYLVRKTIRGRVFWGLHPVKAFPPLRSLVNENFEVKEPYASRLRGGIGIHPSLIRRVLEFVEIYRPDLVPGHR